MIELISRINGELNSLVWGIPMMILIIGTGVYFSVRTDFIQFKKFKYAIKNTIGKIFKKPEKVDKGAMTPFQAMTTALAGTLGTGNIAGVTGAIALGGPGAVFWMWVSSLFGMCTKYAEIVLAVKFRERNVNGDWVGGPMYYIKNGLGKSWQWLASVFAVIGMLAALGMGNIAQGNTISSSVNTAIQAFYPAAEKSAGSISLIVGIISAAFVGLVILGGLTRIGSVSETLIPFVSIVYIVAALIVVFTNYSNIIPVMRSIFVSAFSPEAALGGAAGIGITQALKSGVGRGVFSNEAGLGSAPIAHASTSETDPVKQGLYGIFEVFIDTIVVCTLTALTVLLSGAEINYGAKVGAELTISAFATTFGSKVAGLIIAFGIIFFALSTMLSWSLYGTRCTEYLFGTRYNKLYQIIFIIFIVFGATMDLGLAWEISDTLNGLMALPNLIALLGLSGVVVSLTKKYFSEHHLS